MRSGRGPAGAPTKTNHYDDPSSDSPAWIDENTGSATLSATRYVTGLDGNLVASVAHSGTTSATWQLVNLHGDVVTTCTDNTTLTTPDRPTLDADEYGNPRNTATARYGWLGGKQRSTDSLAGLTLMGVRLYSPVLGRFLQTDPEPGGSCNDYDYTCADPINAYDLDGKRCWFGRHRNGGCRGGRLARGTDRILSNPVGAGIGHRRRVLHGLRLRCGGLGFHGLQRPQAVPAVRRSQLAVLGRDGAGRRSGKNPDPQGPRPPPRAPRFPPVGACQLPSIQQNGDAKDSSSERRLRRS